MQNRTSQCAPPTFLRARHRRFGRTPYATEEMTPITVSSLLAPATAFLPDCQLRDDVALREVLLCERLRADRSGGKFSVLCFDFTGEAAKHQTVEQMVRYLNERSRRIDSVGATKEKTVWLVLPGCSADAASVLAREICEMSSSHGVNVRPEVFFYHAATDNDQGGIERRTAARNGHSEPAGTSNGNGHHRESEEPRRQPRYGLDVPTRSLDTVLVLPTPFWKRLLDLFVAATGLLILLPVFAVVAAAVKMSSPGPVLFRQWRSGRGGIPFRICKFRSMIADAEAQKARLMSQNECDGPAFKMQRDPRVTPIGRILRRTNLDELPQLWNVLVGQMSIVGPRPLPCQETAACESWQHERLHVTPGVTCFWQAAEKRSTIPFAEWMRMDLRYVRCRSFLVDLKLVAQTANRVFRDTLCLDRS